MSFSLVDIAAEDGGVFNTSFWNNSSMSTNLYNLNGSDYVGGDTYAGFFLSGITSGDYTVRFTSGPGGLGTGSRFGCYLTIGGNTIGVTYSGTDITINDNNGNTNTFNCSGLTTEGVTVTVTVSPSGGSACNIVVCVFTDYTMSTQVATAFLLNNAIEGDIYTDVSVQCTVGNTLNDFVIASAGIYSGDAPCFAHDSIIETVNGDKLVQDLDESDLIYDDCNRIVRVIKLWKTLKPVTKQCVTMNRIVVSNKHLVRQKDGDVWEPSEKIGSLHIVTNYFYQIQVMTYGIYSEGYVFATWTDDYVAEHPDVVAKMN